MNDRGRLKPEKGILDLKKIMALIAGLIVNNVKTPNVPHSRLKRKPYPVLDQNDQNRYSISGQNVFKKHTYIAHIREYSSLSLSPLA